MKTLRLETTAPFQGLAELVADDEGLFEAQGITIEWVARDHTSRETDTAVTSQVWHLIKTSKRDRDFFTALKRARCYHEPNDQKR